MFKSTTNKHGHRAFTLSEPGLLREIIMDCKVSLPYNPAASGPFSKHPPMIDAKALWDTGASNCAITPELIKKLGIAPFRKVDVHHADGVTEKDVYKINIILPGNVGFSYLNVTECKSTAGAFEIIIGMDVITKGDFAITNVGGNTKVSFRIPSSVTIDFNDGETIIKGPAISSATTIPAPTSPTSIPSNTPRNADCPCGSGKKYKNCHGKTS